jgi:hypothetical protein
MGAVFSFGFQEPSIFCAYTLITVSVRFSQSLFCRLSKEKQSGIRLKIVGNSAEEAVCTSGLQNL